MTNKIIANELLPVYETDTGEKIVDGRELHDFLKVGRDFSTWMKDRILKLDLTEGEEYSPVLGKTSNSGGRPTMEYVIKLDTAKEIAMMENNEQGSKARKYFIDIEKRFKSQSIDISLLSPEMQMFKQIFDGQVKIQLEAAETQRRLQSVQTAVTTIQETIIQRDDGNWRNEINALLNKIGKRSGKFKEIRSESYQILEERGRYDLAKRVRFMRDRLTESGATKTKVESISRLDVIEAEPRLKEIYTGIVKELAIKYMSFGD